MTKRPTCLIADDEPNLLAALKGMLTSIWPELEIIAEANSGPAALTAFNARPPDIAFLDIQMPGFGEDGETTGLKVAAAMEDKCHVVFITAHPEHAIAAFDTGAVDFIQKPLDLVRLTKMVDRLKGRLGAPPPAIAAMLKQYASPAPQTPKLQWIQASVGNQVRFVPLEDVLYFQSDAKYTKVQTVDGEALIRLTIKELVDQLDGAHFWQTHRGSIVNTKYLHGVVRETDGSMEVVVKGRKERLPVSQPFHYRFRQM